MTKFLKISLKVLLLASLLGCYGDNKGVILRHAEECMETSPDSVIRMLEEIEENSFDSESQRAKYALLWTQARHKCHLPLGNDSLINVAVDYYTLHEERQYAAKDYYDYCFHDHLPFTFILYKRQTPVQLNRKIYYIHQFEQFLLLNQHLILYHFRSHTLAYFLMEQHRKEVR